MNQYDNVEDNTSLYNVHTATENDILRSIATDHDLWERHKQIKRKSKNQLNEDYKRVKHT